MKTFQTNKTKPYMKSFDFYIKIYIKRRGEAYESNYGNV